MSLYQFKENECLLITPNHCLCVEFILGARPESDLWQRHGFHVSQLIHYRLEANEGGHDAPPQRLTVAFATADVTLTGWRLDRMADYLRNGELLAVRALSTRYANLDTSKCCVVSISVESVGKD